MSLRKFDSSTKTRPLLVIYIALHLYLCIYSLFAAVQLYEPHETARATLRLLSAFSLLPALYIPPKDSPTKHRWPILVSFLIALALLIDAVLRFIDAGDTILDGPTQYHTSKSLLSLIVHLALHIILAFALRRVTNIPDVKVFKLIRFMLPSGHRTSKHNISPVDTALYLHAVAAVLARLVDLVSATNVSSRLLSALDVFAASITVAGAFPLFQSSARVLIHAIPPSLSGTLLKKRDQISKIEGILSCGNIIVWEETHERLIGTLCVTVDTTVSRSKIMSQVTEILDGLIHDFTLQVDTWQDGPHQRLEVTVPK